MRRSRPTARPVLAAERGVRHDALDSSAAGTYGNVAGTASPAASAGAIAGDTAATSTARSGLVVAQQPWDVADGRTAPRLWFKTTTTRAASSSASATRPAAVSASYDRHVYMQNDGKLAFGVEHGVQHDHSSARPPTTTASGTTWSPRRVRTA